MGGILVVIKGDTRSLGYGSHAKLLLHSPALPTSNPGMHRHTCKTATSISNPKPCKSLIVIHLRQEATEILSRSQASIAPFASGRRPKQELQVSSFCGVRN